MIRRFSIPFAVVVALSLAGAQAPSAKAKSTGCAKRGYTVAQKSGPTVVMSRTVRDKKVWDGAAESFYLCSRAWGRRVHMGSFGVSWDGEIAFGAMTLTDRYVTWSEGTSDNASSVSDDSVYRADLKTGKKERWSPGGDVGDSSVAQTVVNDNGAVGWTVGYYADKSSHLDVYLVDTNGRRLVASDAGWYSLAFVNRDGGSKLVWPTTMAFAPFVPGTASNNYPRKPKRCGKSGYAVASRTDATVVMSRRVRGGIFEDAATRFYACSHNYGKRVTVGTFGVHSEGESCQTAQSLGGRFAAFVLGSGGNSGGCSSNTIMLVDLKTGAKRSTLASTIPARYNVSSIVVNDDGTVAWVVDPGAQQREVWTANLRSTTKLAADPEIDPLFLQFGLGDDFKRIAWATATGSVTVN